jgi:hypothetical protein
MFIKSQSVAGLLLVSFLRLTLLFMYLSNVYDTWSFLYARCRPDADRKQIGRALLLSIAYYVSILYLYLPSKLQLHS